jgi:hypothetical protein
MVKKYTESDAHPRAFVNIANEYYTAANTSFGLSEQPPKKVNRQSEFSNPIYFLYFHAMELALKAYLVAQKVQIAGTHRRRGHPVKDLYEECRRLGLIVGQMIASRSATLSIFWATNSKPFATSPSSRENFQPWLARAKPSGIYWTWLRPASNSGFRGRISPVPQ